MAISVSQVFFEVEALHSGSMPRTLPFTLPDRVRVASCGGVGLVSFSRKAVKVGEGRAVPMPKDMGQRASEGQRQEAADAASVPSSRARGASDPASSIIPAAAYRRLGGEVALVALQQLPTAALLFDEHRRIIFVNLRSLEVLKQCEAELLGRLVDTLFVPQDEGACLVFGDEERGECLAQLNEETTIDVGYSCKTIVGLDGHPLSLVTFRNTSRLKELERERDRLIRIATIGQALPSLLHELKNPLAAISTATEVLLEETTDPEVTDQLHAILSEIRRMRLSFDGIGALDRPLRSRRLFAIDFAIKEAGSVLIHRANNSGQHLRVQVQPMPLLPLDAAVVRALVLNFVTNAIQAGKPGCATTLNAWHEREAERLELRVVDTGQGMDPRTLARITELFFSTKRSGSGIGLSLCKRVVEGAGGTMEINSVPGFGTAVNVSVPTGNDALSGRKNNVENG